MAWRVIGASVAGLLHVENGRGCDDAHGWSTGEDLTVLAVADGAGSRSGTSAIGAHVAVARTLDLVTEDPAMPLPALFDDVLAALRAEAAVLDINVDALATTLCVALLGTEHTAVGQIGDGIAVIERQDGTIESVSIPDRSEYANETVFVTSHEALDQLKIFEVDEPVRCVALSSDGLRYRILEVTTYQPFEPFFRTSWDYARTSTASSESIQRFLARLDDQTGDDKTLLLAVNDFDGGQGPRRSLSDRAGTPVVDPEPASPSAA